MRFRPLLSSLLFVALTACGTETLTSNQRNDGLRPTQTATRSTSVTPGTTLTFVSAADPSVCIEANGGGASSGAAIETAVCNGSAAQRFTFQSGNLLKTSGGLCVDVRGGWGNNGDVLIAYTCHGEANQQWTLDDRGQIVGMNGKCLDIPGGRTAAGTALVLWSCHGGSNQGWQAQTITDAPAPAAPSAPVAPPAVRVGKYVAPNGSSGGSGTISSPLDLQTALNGGRVSPGDTVWVRGGTYRGQFVNWLNGTSTARITVRAVPGERATIDGNVVVMGSNVTFWGLEVMNSNPVSVSAQGLNIKAPNSRFINLVVHDQGMSGMGVWTEAPNAEVYGSLVYNNGTHPNLDHGIYAQGNDGVKRISDNVIFNNWTYGLHAYSGSGGYIRNFDVQGNTSFNNGTTGPYRTAPDLFIGGDVPAENVTFVANNTFRTDRGTSMSMGYDADRQNGSLVLRDNYVVGGLDIFRWTSLTNSGNTVVGGTPSTGTRVVVRPNKYEAGRANVTVYNWANQGSVNVDLAGVLSAGDSYVVKNVLDFYGAPVASGTFDGSSINIPIRAFAPPATIGRTANVAPSTGTQFNVYVVMRAGT